MHQTLKDIPDRIVQNAVDALSEANHKCIYGPGPGSQIWHYDYYCVLDAAHAGELFMKALIAKEHPLLIFKNLFRFNTAEDDAELTIEKLIKSGETHDFGSLPNVLWAVCNEKINDRKNFEFIRKARNSIQHFVTPEDRGENGFRRAALKFLHEEIGQLVAKHLGIHTIEHLPELDDLEILFGALVRDEIRFVFPAGFRIEDFDLDEEFSEVSDDYRAWLDAEVERLDR